MKVAIDIDGTIGRYPRLFAPIMAAWVRAGFQVRVLTGNVQYRRGIDNVGVLRGTHYEELVIVPGANLEDLGLAKAEYLRTWVADCFIDDHEPYCEKARAANPAMMILRVFP